MMLIDLSCITAIARSLEIVEAALQTGISGSIAAFTAACSHGINSFVPSLLYRWVECLRQGTAAAFASLFLAIAGYGVMWSMILAILVASLTQLPLTLYELVDNALCLIGSR